MIINQRFKIVIIAIIVLVFLAIPTFSAIFTEIYYNDSSTIKYFNGSANHTALVYFAIPKYSNITSAFLDVTNTTDNEFAADNVFNGYWSNDPPYPSSQCIDGNWETPCLCNSSNSCNMTSEYTVPAGVKKVYASFSDSCYNPCTMSVSFWNYSSSNYVDIHVGGYGGTPGTGQNLFKEIPLEGWSSSPLKMLYAFSSQGSIFYSFREERIVWIYHTNETYDLNTTYMNENRSVCSANSTGMCNVPGNVTTESGVIEAFNPEINYTVPLYIHSTNYPYYVTGNQNIVFNITNITAIDSVYVSINGTKYDADFWDFSGTDYQYNFTISSDSFSNGNYSLIAYANDTVNWVNGSSNFSLIVDSIAPKISSLSRSDDSFYAGNGVNISGNIIEQYVNWTNLTVYYSDGTVKDSYQWSTPNNSIEYNFSSTGSIGNFTFNYTARDLAGNENSSVVYVAIGRINATPYYISSINFTTFDNAWGVSSGLSNGTVTSFDSFLKVNLTVDGFLASKTGTINFNISSIYDNWTYLNATNSTGAEQSITIIDDNITFTSEQMSTGESVINDIEIHSTNAITYEYTPVGLNYYYFLGNNFTESFSIYSKINLPPGQEFSIQSFHPRYFVCTGTVTQIGCSAFSVGVDVTSGNDGSNSISGYPVNMHVDYTDTTASQLTFQSNHTNFLIQINIIAGAYQEGSGSPENGGGGGGEGYIPPTCPDGYEYIESLGQCLLSIDCPIGTLKKLDTENKTFYCEEIELPITEVENILLKQIFGPINVFWLIVIVIIIVSLPSLIPKRFKRFKHTMVK